MQTKRVFSCELVLSYPSDAEAEVVLRSLEPDNAGFVEAEREGNRVVLFARADTPLSLLHTLNDLLACVSVAEKTMSVGSGR